jgi:hypothetical protein
VNGQRFGEAWLGGARSGLAGQGKGSNGANHIQ